MANESRQSPATNRAPQRGESELDREPGSNRGTRGQTRESRNVARSAEEDIQTMAGHDAPDKSDRTEK
jgi:hypothetical protein